MKSTFRVVIIVVVIVLAVMVFYLGMGLFNLAVPR